MKSRVFKFGGASVKNADGVRNLQKILQLFKNEHIVVVISAIGKTTNLLEKIVEAWYFDKAKLPELIEELKNNHYQIVYDLGINCEEIIAQLDRFINKMQQILGEEHADNFDFDYDRIVSFGEYLSTTLVSNYLSYNQVDCTWLDAAKMIRTDNTYREGKVDWTITVKEVRNQIENAYKKSPNSIIITQGFIAGTSELLRTTLGREGSDYSASIIAYSIDAEEVTIWKDVPGVLNADPKFFPNPIKLDELPYQEAIELSFYGASVIHPKTLKPLQNKQIPLYVKSFFHPTDEGTIIANLKLKSYHPSFIIKKEQILISISTKDFSFITENHLSEIFNLLIINKIKINLMQNSALSFSICIDNKPHRIANLLKALNPNFSVKYNEKVELITIRHYNTESIDLLLKNRKIILEQKNRATLQAVVRL